MSREDLLKQLITQRITDEVPHAYLIKLAHEKWEFRGELYDLQLWANGWDLSSGWGPTLASSGEVPALKAVHHFTLHALPTLHRALRLHARDAVFEHIEVPT